MKKRIAVWMPGGVGGGYYSQGIPVISKLIDDLSSDFDITIYSLYPANPDFTPTQYSLFSPSTKIQWSWLRWLVLIGLFLKHSIRQRYQILYSFWGYPSGVIATCLAKLFRVSCVIHLQGGDAVFIPSIRYGSLRGFKEKIIRWAYKHSTVLIALTEFQKNKLTEWGLKRSVDVIPFGVHTDLFKSKGKFNPHKPIRFLHVGNLIPVKDQRVLLDTFSIIAKQIPATLLIIGEDHLEGAIQVYCKNLGLGSTVSFVDIQPYDFMPTHYEWADVLLHTSVFEGQCMAMVEAAASGVLIACTRTGILSDWGDTCGVVVDIKDSTGLADGILDLLNNQNEIQKRINLAQANVVSTTWTSGKVKQLLHSL